MTHFHALPTLKDGERQLTPGAPLCTTACILGACKVSLEQGKYIFTHKIVLCNAIKASKTFILNIKPAVRIFDKSSIFVKKKE